VKAGDALSVQTFRDVGCRFAESNETNLHGFYRIPSGLAISGAGCRFGMDVPVQQS